MNNKQIKEEKTCDNCHNCYKPYVCKQYDVTINERKLCDKHVPYPKPIAVKELITILEKLPQDSLVKVDTEGLFAVVGAYTEEDSVYIDVDLIAW